MSGSDAVIARRVGRAGLLFLLGGILAGCEASSGTAGPAATSSSLSSSASDRTTESAASPSAAGTCAVSVYPPTTAPDAHGASIVGSGFAAGAVITLTFRDVGGGKLLTVDGRTQPELNTDGDGRFGSVNRPADAGTSLVIEASDGTCTASAAWRIGTRLLAAMTAPPPVDSCETRAIADRIDARSGDQLHLVYALPSDGTDLHLDTDGSLAAFVQSADDWLTKRIAGRRLRIDVCDAKPDVTFARLPGTDVAYRGEPDPWGVIEDSLHAAGLTDPAKRWIVFYGGTGPDRACMAQGTTADQPGRSVVVFLRDRSGGTCEPLGSPSEGPGRPQFEMLAATLRMLGLPGACAPHAAGDGTVDDDPNDLLAPTLPADPQIDVGHDDYYDAHVRGCPDLTSSEDIER